MGVWNTFLEGDNLALIAALEPGSVDLVYTDLDPDVRFAAEASTAAQLSYLAEAG